MTDALNDLSARKVERAMLINESVHSEAVSLAKIITIALVPTSTLTDDPREDIVRLIEEALQTAYNYLGEETLQAEPDSRTSIEGREPTYNYLGGK